MKKFLLAAFTLLLLATAAVVWVYWQAVGYPDSPGPGAGAMVEIVVPKGVSPTALCKQLESSGLVERADFFCWYMRYSGGFSGVQAGPHSIPDSATPNDLLFVHLVKKPKAEEITLSIREGLTLVEMAPIVEASGLATAEGFLALVKDEARARADGIPYKNMEGFLFPDTYRFRPASGAAVVVDRLRSRMKEVLAELKAANPEGFATLGTLGWGEAEWVNLAAMVQMETGPMDDPKNIASVFLNRMLNPKFVPKLLASDPTIMYGLGPDFDGNLLRKHLEDRSNPYNTYTHPGLPPGPIAAPGRAALESVVAPAETKYLFFVAKGDGSSYFSPTYAEHDRAVTCYQRRGSCAGLPPRP